MATLFVRIVYYFERHRILKKVKSKSNECKIHYQKPIQVLYR
jgi:hypothetical protein